MKQYANSPVIQSIREKFDSWYGVNMFEDFYNKVWNVDTATGWGLDVWGRIVVIGRYLNIEGGEFFGYQTGAVPEDWKPYNNAPFYTGKKSTSTYRLADDAYRVLILAKAMKNISDLSCRDINQILQQLFDGICYVNDLGNMQMRYVFEFDLTDWEIAIIKSGILPRPCGVRAYVLQMPSETFGFYGTGLSGFGQGALYSSRGIINVA